MSDHRHDGGCSVNCSGWNPADDPQLRPSSHTPKRTVRVEDELWDAAQAKANDRGETLSAVLRAALLRYVKRK